MKKAELQAALASKFTRVLRTQARDTTGGITFYQAEVFDIVGDTGQRQTVAFYVVDEGTEAEEAVWHGREPKPEPVTRFQQELVAWLNSKIDDGTILIYELHAINEAMERATVTATLEQAGAYVDRKLGVYKDAQGDFAYVQIAA